VTVSLSESAANLGVGRHTSFLEITNTGLLEGITNRPVLLTVVANVPRITGVVPNPFGNGDYPETEIRFTLGGPATVIARIYDIRGGRVKDLGSMAGVAGENHFTWKGNTDLGGSAPSGKYIFILYALDREERTNIILVH
jgi:flagellar hook assembly protein FlgD